MTDVRFVGPSLYQELHYPRQCNVQKINKSTLVKHPSRIKMSSAENNPGNFANRPKEEVSEIGRKGGQSSHSGGFASMDPDTQV